MYLELEEKVADKTDERDKHTEGEVSPSSETRPLLAVFPWVNTVECIR